MPSFAEMIENITPEIHQRLQLAIQIGKWPDGRKLTPEQKALSLQAIIVWESQNLPEDQRTGYLGGNECGSKSGSKDQAIPNQLFTAAETLH